MSYYIREALIEDASTIAPLLREADKNEIAASTGSSPVDAMMYSIMGSKEAFVACLPDGTPVALFGIGDDGVGYGVPWMVGTDDMIRFSKSLVKDARKWVDKKTTEYPMLYNYVDSRNTVHINWLRRIGFTVSEIPEYFAVSDVPFYLFTRSN